MEIGGRIRALSHWGGRMMFCLQGVNFGWVIRELVIRDRWVLG
jgi:hypothetical protein